MAILWNQSRRTQELALFTRHLEGAMRARAPLADVIAAFADEADTRSMQRALGQVAARTQAGAPLSEALGEAPHVFPESYRRIVRMGEESQTLPSVVANLATALEEGLVLHESFRRAAVYPLIVTVLLFVEVSLFMGLSDKLIGIQQSASLAGFFDSFISRASFSIFPVLLLFFVAVLWLLAAAAGLAWNTYRHGRLLLQLPLVGPALRLSETSRFLRHLGLMLENRIPLTEATGLLADAATNGYMRAALDDFRQRLARGEDLGSVIRSQAVFPASVGVVLASAQERGNLHETLVHLADFYRERTLHALRLVREFFEPLMLLLAGILVAWCVFALYQPLGRFALEATNAYY